MKKHTRILTTLLLLACYALASAQKSKLQLNQDTVALRSLIDSAYSLNGKDFRRSVILSVEALSKARTSKSKSLIKRALYNAAMLDWYDGVHPQALDKMYEYLALVKRSKDNVQIAKSYSQLGLIYLYTSDYDSSLYYFDQSLKYYNVLDDTTQLMKNYGFKGLVYSLQGDYLNAKKNLLAKTLLKRQHITTNWAVLNLSNDEILSKKYYQESLIEAKKSASILEKTDTPSLGLRSSYHDIGISYLKLNQPDSALLHFKKATGIAQLINIDPYWNEWSRAYTALGYYDSAIVSNQKAIENSLDHGTRISLANGYHLLGSSYKSSEDYQNAIYAYKKALNLHTLMGHKFAQMTLLLQLSETHYEYNQLGQALIYTDSAINIADRIGTKKGLSDGFLSRFTILKSMENFESALEVKSKYDMLTDSLNKEKLQLDLAKLDLYHDVKISKLEISDLNKQQALSKTNLKNQKLTIIIIIVVCIFVTSMLVLNYLKTRNLTKLNSKLNEQQHIITNQNKTLTKRNEEKEVLLGEVHHRVKNSLQTISSLLNMQQRKLSDPAAVSAIKDSQKRVQVMGLLYKFVYQHDNFEEIALKPYMEQLVKMLMKSHQSDTETSCEILVCNIETNVDTAINLGLVINELIINSLKYAVSAGHILQIKLDITHRSETLNITLSDNGAAPSNDLPHEKSGFGWKLIQSLVEKAGGRLNSQYNKGLSVNIQIPLKDNATTAYVNET